MSEYVAVDLRLLRLARSLGALAAQRDYWVLGVVREAVTLLGADQHGRASVRRELVRPLDPPQSST